MALASVRPPMGVPERSIEQRGEALLLANHVRSYRAQMKRGFKLGVVAPRVAWTSDATELQSMKVSDLLIAIPKVGRVKAGKALARAGVSHSKTLGGLTDKQRERLELYVPQLRGKLS